MFASHTLAADGGDRPEPGATEVDATAASEDEPTGASEDATPARATGTDEAATGDDHDHAGLSSRLAAHVVDVLVLLPVFWGSMTVVAVATGNAGGAGFSMSGGDAWLAFGVYFLLMAAYLVGFEGLLGWTPGKRLLGIRVATEDGASPGVRAALLRNATRLLEGAPFFWFFLFYPVSLVLINENDRRLGDRFADTVVVSAD